MLFQAPALAALCALSVVKTIAASTKNDNEETLSVHRDAIRADFGDVSTYKDSFVPRSIVGTRLAKQAALVGAILQNQDGDDFSEKQFLEAPKTVNGRQVLNFLRNTDNHDFDARKELGILDTEQLPIPGMAWGSDNRRLKDTSSLFDCDTYLQCSMPLLL